MTCPWRLFPLRMKSLVGCTSYIAAQKETPNTSTIQQQFEIPQYHPQEGHKKTQQPKKKTTTTTLLYLKKVQKRKTLTTCRSFELVKLPLERLHLHCMQPLVSVESIPKVHCWIHLLRKTWSKPRETQKGGEKLFSKKNVKYPNPTWNCR